MAAHEDIIKCGVIAELSAEGALAPGTVVANEFVIGKSDRRADLVVINGHLQAFEVKSSRDNLSRLSDQAENYLRYFDEVTIVCTHTHYTAVREELGAICGIWLFNEGTLRVEKKKAARKRKISPCKSNLISLLTVRELRKLARLTPTKESRYMSRAELEKICLSIPRQTVYENTLEMLKRRHTKPFNEFLKSAAAQGIRPTGLRLLSRFVSQSEETPEHDWEDILERIRLAH